MGKAKSGDRHAWEAPFLKALRKYGSVKRAASAAGITTGPVYNRRQRSEEFVEACTKAREAFHANGGRVIRNSADKPAPRQWKRTFLDMLAETSNVTASASEANVSVREVYRTRRSDEDFAGEWRTALFEGYANLEMEVLGFLRDPAPTRKLDVAAALRLLTAHKDTIATERAARANVSAAEVRASIERKVEIFRQQVAAEQARKARD
ncbi:hypothetical protein [Qipengyuania soli]|uniref:Terminase n=1 Tax=Qipengyuania soli TaxID=2782568 RepID=A0A7S8IUF2_9SPHN|nr:hypothetical protein [Qipengyuania soli]QPC98552.1 hypothetical protein IRL76_11980 [Qipengyuania soli]